MEDSIHFLCENNSHRNENEKNIYIWKKKNGILIFCICMDDIIFMDSSQNLVD